MQLKNKIILVTGGSGLIGEKIVSFLNRSGAIAINADIAVETDLGKNELCFNICDDVSVTAGIDLIIETYGRIDGLVNNAYPRTKDWGLHFEDIPIDSWRKNVDMQLNSAFLLCQKVVSKMLPYQSGSIVNIASIYGIVGNDFSLYEDYEGTSPAAYSAIKGGLINFTRYLASYVGKYGIRVNCVSPGGIKDELNQHPSFIQKYEARVPLKRLGRPEDIAAPIAFLLSDDAGYITGHNLVVDGGWTAI